VNSSNEDGKTNDVVVDGTSTITSEMLNWLCLATMR